MKTVLTFLVPERQFFRPEIIALDKGLEVVMDTFGGVDEENVVFRSWHCFSTGCAMD